MARKTADELLDEAFERANLERFLEINEEYRDEVPESFDAAAEKTFREMASWVALGSVPASVRQAASSAKAATIGAAKTGAAGACIKVLSAVLAAALIGVGSIAVIPGAGNAVKSVLHTEQAEPAGTKAPEDYSIPSPGENYTLREDVSSGRMAAKWFEAERRHLMVQIAKTLPELPEGDCEAVSIGGSIGLYYEDEGDQQLLLQDGGMYILIQMHNASRQELMDYAELFAEANGL